MLQFAGRCAAGSGGLGDIGPGVGPAAALRLLFRDAPELAQFPGQRRRCGAAQGVAGGLKRAGDDAQGRALNSRIARLSNGRGGRSDRAHLSWHCICGKQHRLHDGAGDTGGVRSASASGAVTWRRAGSTPISAPTWDISSAWRAGAARKFMCQRRTRCSAPAARCPMAWTIRTRGG